MEKGVRGVNEEIILAYVKEKTGKSAPSSMSTYISMLKRMLQTKENVNIGNYGLVTQFLKKYSKNYEPKKSLVLDVNEIKKILWEAPDSTFLMIKVAVIMGFFGGCRRQELYKMKTTDVEDKGSVLIVKVPETKTSPRVFTVLDVENEISYLDLYRRYIAVRPAHMKNEKLFLFFQLGKCRAQVVGLNSFSKMPMKVAAYLGLENPHLYTGHCFRRSSATSLANAGANMTTMKRHGAWRSTSVAERYIADSIGNKIEIANKIGMGRFVKCENSTAVRETQEETAAERYIADSIGNKIEIEKKIGMGKVVQRENSTVVRETQEETAAERYIADSIGNKIEIAKKIGIGSVMLLCMQYAFAYTLRVTAKPHRPARARTHHHGVGSTWPTVHRKPPSHRAPPSTSTL